MKKVLYLLVTILFTLTLVSCKKGKQITLSYDKNEIEIFVGEEVNVKPNVEVLTLLPCSENRLLGILITKSNFL